MSLPVRERGLKLGLDSCEECHHIVAPRAGAWIEIAFSSTHGGVSCVAPRAGAWIEIQ